jgi:hypothetical protein
VTTIGDLEHVVPQEMRDFPICRQLLMKHEVQSGGDEITHDIVLQGDGNMRFVLPGEETPFIQQENMRKVRQRWALGNVNMHFDEIELQKAYSRGANGSGGSSKREVLKRGFLKVQDLYKTRREQNVIIPWLDGWEKALLDVPSSVEDDRSPHGIPAWICMANAGVTGIDFNGQTLRYGDASTSTVIGGIDRSKAENKLTRNMTCTYTKIDSDFLQKMFTIKTRLGFKSIPKSEATEPNKFSNYKIFCGTDVYLELARLAQVRQESKYVDLTIDSDGVLRYMGIEICDTPRMEFQSAHPIWKYRPIYWVNMSKFKVISLENFFMKESEPMRISATRHRQFGIQVDTMANTFCFNSQRQAVMHLPIPA